MKRLCLTAGFEQVSHEDQELEVRFPGKPPPQSLQSFSARLVASQPAALAERPHSSRPLLAHCPVFSVRI